MHVFAIATLHLLQFLAALPVLLSYNIALPDCTDTCGNVSIPYPFGIGDERCYRDGFKLVCDMTYNPPKLFMNDPGYEVIKIKLARGVLHIDTGILRLLGSDSYNQNWTLSLDDKLYRVSAAKNVFITLGCGFRFLISLPGSGDNASTCASTCRPGYPMMASDGTCSGIGCCDTAVTADHNSYTIRLVPLNDTKSSLSRPRAPFNASMIVVKGEWWRSANAVSLQKEILSRLSAPVGAPDYGQVGIRTVVNWMLSNSSCAEAEKLADFGCLSNNSDCRDDPLRGYVCLCRPGFEGGLHAKWMPRHRRVHAA